jgi:hypothetical protein
MANYPNSPITFTTKVDGTTVVQASDPNLIQNEVIAIGTALGLNPFTSTTPNPSASFNALSNQFTDLNARLANIEIGIVADSHTQYIKKAGGETITSSASSVKGLVIKGAASQSANLQEWQNSAGTAVAYVTPAGGLVDTKLTNDINNLYVLNYVFG